MPKRLPHRKGLKRNSNHSHRAHGVQVGIYIYTYIYIYLIYTQPNIYPKISRYIYIEQIYTQARRLDSYNFLFFLGIIMIFFLVSWLTDENSNSFAPFQAAISWLGASGSAVRKWSWLGWINESSISFRNIIQPDLSTWRSSFFFSAFKCVSSFCPHFSIWLWSLKGRFIRIRAIKAMLSSLLSKELDLFLSETLLTTKRTFPRIDGWLVLMDKILLRIFEATLYIGVNLLVFFHSQV